MTKGAAAAAALAQKMKKVRSRSPPGQVPVEVGESCERCLLKWETRGVSWVCWSCCNSDSLRERHR